MPLRIEHQDGHSADYVYDASGVKLQMKNNTVGMALITKDYRANKVYENTVLKMILTEDGYVEPNSGSFNYYFFIKDHLGNNRVVADKNGTVAQITNFYPFGMSHAEVPARNDQHKQPYKFNGKELDRMFGLDTYDYSARMYSPAIGRFMTMDPLAEKYYSLSPYAYCMNNPVRYVDLKGDSVRVYTETNREGHTWMSVGEGDDMVVYSYGRYNGTNKGPDGSSNTLSNGPGVLLRLTGEEAKTYNEGKAAAGMSVFVVTDVADETIANAMDEKFNSSTTIPDNPNSKYYNNPSAHVIDEYSLTSNNCTTIVSDALNNNGSTVLKGTMYQQTSTFGTWTTVPVTHRFVLPASMQNYFIKTSNPQGTVYRTR